MVDIKAEINPMRLKFGNDKKVELMIQVINNGEKTRLTSCDIILSNHLAFDKTGRQNAIVRRLGELKANEKKLFYLDIYPKMSVSKGAEPIYISATEHFEKDYDYVLNKKTKQLDLRIE
jgi:hypothetical protein